MQLKNKPGITTKSLENLVILRRFGHFFDISFGHLPEKKLFLRKNVTPYMNRRSLTPLGSLYFLTQYFKNSLKTLDHP